MLNRLLAIALIASTVFTPRSVADVKISQLPLGSAASSNVGDSFPYVDSVAGETKRLTLWDLVNLPPIASVLLPSQSGNAGKYLTTNGTTASWGTVVSGVSTFNLRTGAVTFLASDFLGALATPTPSATSVLEYDGTNFSWVSPSVIGGVTSFNTRTGAVTLSSSDVTGALTYTPVNKAGDSMSGALSVPALTDTSLSAGPARINSSSVLTTGATNLASSDVTGNLPVTNLNSGTSASNSTFWRGDGTWAVPPVATTPTPVPIFAGSTPGLVPNSTNSGTLFLRDDGTFASVPTPTPGATPTPFPAQAANVVFAGPTALPSASPAFRALVGADLPNPSSTSLGGVISATPTPHQWLNSISTSGVPALSQPAFSDISGTLNFATQGTGIVSLANGGTGRASTSNSDLFSFISPITAAGGMIYGGTSGADVQLSPGSNGSQLILAGGLPVWTPTPTPAPSPGIGVQGQLSTAVNTTSLLVPNSQATVTSTGSTLIETGNNNILANPSFEGSSLGSAWGLLVGTGSIDTSVFMHGLSSYKIVLSSAQSGPILAQDVTNSQTANENFEYTIWAKTSTAGFRFCPQSNGDILSQCQLITPDGNWHSYTSNYISSTINGIEIAQTLVSTGGTINLDNAYVGIARNLGSVSLDSDWLSSTCVSTWTTNATTTCKVKRVGDTAFISFNVALTGAPNSASLSFSMPSGLSIDTSKFTGNATSFALDGTVNGNRGTTGTFLQPLYVGTNTILVAYVSSSSTASQGAVNATTPVTWASGDNITVTVHVPIVGWSSSISTANINSTVDMTGLMVMQPTSGCPSGTLQADGSTVSASAWPHYVSLFGTTLPNENGLFTRATGTQTVGGISYSGPAVNATQGDVMQGHLHASPQAFMNFNSYGSSSGQYGANSSLGGTIIYQSASVAGIPSTDGTNGTPRTGFETRGVNRGVNMCVIMNWTTSAPVTIGSVISSNTTGAEVVNRAKINCSSTSSIVSQSGSWIASVGNVSNGTCAVTINSGVFSDIPTCSVSLKNTASTSLITSNYINPTSSTAFTLGGTFVLNNTNTVSYSTNNNYEVICNGPK